MAQTRKFIVQPTDDKLAAYPPAVRDLVKNGELTEEAAREEIQALISTVKKDYLNIRTRELARRISEAEKNDEKENLKALLQELSNLRIYGAN